MENKKDENILPNTVVPRTNSKEPIADEQKKTVSAARNPRAASAGKTTAAPIEETEAASGIIKPEIVKPIDASQVKATVTTGAAKKSETSTIPEENRQKAAPSDVLVSVPKEEKAVNTDTENATELTFRKKAKNKLKKKKEKAKKREKAIKAVIKKLEKAKKVKLKEKAKKKEKATKQKAKEKAKKAAKKKAKKTKSKNKK